MANIKEIEALTNVFDPNGFEDGVIREVKNQCGGLDVADDAMYNVYATMKKEKTGYPVLMLNIHLDGRGFMVQFILKNGLLSILMLGGFHLIGLSVHSVIVRTRDRRKHRGIATPKPVHFLTTAQKSDNSLAVEDILVDVGVSGREEVTGVYEIHPGGPIMPDASFEYHKENGILYDKAFNNRPGCVSIIDTMQALRDEADQSAVEAVGAFVAQEEVGARGATVTAQQTQPDLVIVSEGSPTDDFYFCVGTAQECLKSDMQIRHMDNSYIPNVEFIRSAQETGDKFEVKYQDAVRQDSSTNVGRINLTGEVAPVLVLGILSRYVHSHYSFCMEEDVDTIVRVVVEVICGLDEERTVRILRKEVI